MGSSRIAAKLRRNGATSMWEANKFFIALFYKGRRSAKTGISQSPQPLYRKSDSEALPGPKEMAGTIR